VKLCSLILVAEVPISKCSAEVEQVSAVTNDSTVNLIGEKGNESNIPATIEVAEEVATLIEETTASCTSSDASFHENEEGILSLLLKEAGGVRDESIRMCLISS